MKSENNYYKEYLNGDDNAFAHILSQYRTGLIFYINSFVKNPDDAEDIADEVFFRLSVKKPVIRSNLKAYLYKIGRNLAIDHRRKLSHISEQPIEEHSEISYEHVEHDIIRSEQKRLIFEKMSTIPDNYAQVLYLAYFEDFDNASIAKIMKKNNRQIENLLYRAKKQLKGAFTDEDQ